jgi:hypothetical protein
MRAALRALVREVIKEHAAEVSEDALIAVAEFVGANERFDLDAHIGSIRPFVKRYSGLYRVWLGEDPSIDVSALEAEAAKRDYFSATRARSALSEMLESNGYTAEEVPVTAFDGDGFDPYALIRAGIRQHPDHPEMRFLRDVLMLNEYQKEIVVLRVVGRQRKIDPAEL